MRHLTRYVVLLVVIGLPAVPSLAAELRVTGFFDNIFPHFDSNTSNQDLDMTRIGDQKFFGRARSRFFFNFIASDDLRGIFALEIDQTYGAPSREDLGSGCVRGTGAFAFEQCGFRNAIDTNALELKHLYVDFRIPQIPIGNRWRLGGIPADVTPLHPHLLYTMDAGGGSVRFDFTDQASLLLHYIQLEEDLDRFAGSAKIGEDYLTGATFMLKPLAGLDLHLLGIYSHGQAPFGGPLTGAGGPFNAVQGDTINVTTEDRYYLGFDARYRLGNLTLEPSFIYLLGERNFTAASAALTGANSTDFNAFRARLVAVYSTGAWLFGARGEYISGNKAGDDINNRGNGSRSDVKGFRTLGIDGFDRSGEWLELLGRGDVDATGTDSPFGYGERPGFDRFGKIVAAAKAEYKATASLIVEGAVGAFWSAEKTGCPASIRISPTACGGPATRPDGTPAFNFTGDSRFVGWEIDAGLRYTIMPGLTWTPRIGYAFIGDAFNSNNRNAQDAYVIINRVIYTF